MLWPVVTKIKMSRARVRGRKRLLLCDKTVTLETICVKVDALL